MKVIAFGEILWDVYPSEKFIGGASLNFGAHFCRQGGETTLLSSVGHDELGREAIEVLDSYGLITDRVSVLDGYATGQTIVTLGEGGIPSYNVLSDVAYDYIKPLVRDGEFFDSLYFGTLSLRSEYNCESIKDILSRASFSEVFVDVNIRAPHSLPKNIRFALENATILKISDEELSVVLSAAGIAPASDLKETVLKIAEKYPKIKILILTMGSKGSMAYSRADGMIYETKAKKTEVASTVGAGDSFSASFLKKHLEGKTIPECLEFATVVSAFVVSKTEAVPDYPEDLLS